MENKTRFESVGCIVKKEKLAVHYPGYQLADLVLEAQDPFPGYYNFYDYLPEPKPMLLYLVVKTESSFSDDHIIRVTQWIKKHLKLSFDAAPCQISLFNDNYHAIRIDISNMAQLPEVLKAFKDKGIRFASHRDVKQYTGFITIKRYFEVEKAGNNLWHDLNYIENHYIILPEQISWDDFEKITLHIRHNSDMATFDAALGYWYNHNGLVDFVRVYLKQPKPEIIDYLKESYIREVERLLA